jgi:hypothetical protein
MKNFFLFFLILFLFVSCSKDDNSTDNPILPIEINLLSVSTPSGFYQDEPTISSSGHVYLTNNNGELIMESELLNNTTSELNKVYDIENNTYNVTFLINYKYDGSSFYRINTFTNIQPYNLDFNEFGIKAANNERAKVSVINANGFFTEILFNNSPATVEGSINNTVFDLRLEQVPDGLYFSFRHENENFRRYVLLKNATGNTNETFEFQNIPKITDHININYPENDKLDTYISGSQNSDPNNFFAKLSEFHSNLGVTTTSHYFPIDLFQRFKVITNLDQGEKKFRTVVYGNSINLNYNLPNLDFQVTNNSINNYSISSSSSFDYYSAHFNYFNDDDTYNIIWSVYGEQMKNMNFILPKLAASITKDFPDFSIDNLINHATALHKIEGIQTYKQFITTKLGPNSSAQKLITKEESITK